jgi:hypothetical protein
MNNKTLVGIGVVALLAYYLFRKKDKKVVKKEDLQASKNSPAPILANLKRQLTIDDIKTPSTGNSGSGGVVQIRRPRVVLEDIKVGAKEPIVIGATNLVPNIYDRGVGKTLSLSGEDGFYINMSGTCTENIQMACKCSEREKPAYKLDVPMLP